MRAGFLLWLVGVRAIYGRSLQRAPVSKTGRRSSNLPLVPQRKRKGSGKEGCTIARGKYLDWVNPDGLLRIEGWAREGLSDVQIAAKMGIHPATLYKWENDFNEIYEAIKKGKAPVDEEVENALLKRARGYDYIETITDYMLSETEKDEDGNPKRVIKNVRMIKKHVSPDVGAIAFWLKNRRPDRWREKREEQIQVTQADYSLLDEVAKAVAVDE